MKALYETYESNLSLVGEEQVRGNRRFSLLPISHTTQTAHLEVTITIDGNFHSARILDKEITLIPATESSASRAGAKVAPYPLHDKLGYVAGDFKNYGGGKKEAEQFEAYISQLKNWVESPYGNPKIQAIYHYLAKKELIKDLIEDKKFLADDDKLILKWQANLEKIWGTKPEIFTKITGDLTGTFIRFNVRSLDGTKMTPVWEDKKIYQSFTNYYNELLHGEDICFITGKQIPATSLHANKIRNAADKAKLISANDKSGLTFRGRFDKSDEAFSIGYDVSQKAHNALKWLINKQGKVIDGRVFLIWGNSKNVDILDPTEDSLEALGNSVIKTEIKSNTFESFAQEVRKAIDGYKNDLEFKSEVNILVLDAATPGRMSVQYYRNFNKEIYFERLERWHQTCVWVHYYRKNEEKHVAFMGAPATKDIASAAYGSKANERIIKDTMERLLPCILDGQKIPKDLIRTLVHRASNPVSMEFWEWQKTLSIACALINREEEEFNVALNQESTDRSYLFGRLLGVAYELERKALWKKEERRETNAERYMSSFASNPKRTWETIHSNLQPYKAQLGNSANWLYSQIIEITDKFDIDNFNDKPLDPIYLLGFSSQIMEIRNSNKKTEEKEENEE